MTAAPTWEGHLLNGRLRIVRQIGRGGMGAVYEVFHENLRTVLALKQIASDLRDNRAIEKRFQQEAQMMARLQHPNIVRVYDTDRAPEFGSYIVMELIRGRDLGTLLEERGSFTPAETVRIGLGVAAALAYAHEKGIVHRDIKPGNILLEDGTGRPIVTDFGIAKRISGEDATNLTGADTFVGTYRYSSREQIRNDREMPIDGRADIYSMGVVLYELVTGRRYLEGLAELNIASCVGYQENWRPTLQFPEPVPMALRVLLEQCVEPDRERRIASATQLIERLHGCAIERAPELVSGDESPEAQKETFSEAVPSSSGAGTKGPARTAITVTERRAAERTRTIARLRSLRDVVGARLAAFERLLEEAPKLGLDPEELRGPVELTRVVGSVERAEELGDFAAAARQLEELSEGLLARNQRAEGALAGAVAGRLADLRSRWRTLLDRSGALVPEAEEQAARSAFEGVDLALEDREWRACRRGLLRLEALLEESARGAERQGRERITALIAELERLRARCASERAEPGEQSAATEGPAELQAAAEALLARVEATVAAMRAREPSASDAADPPDLTPLRDALEQLEDLASERAEAMAGASLDEADRLADEVRSLGFEDLADLAERTIGDAREGARRLLEERRLREALALASTTLTRAGREHDEARALLCARGRDARVVIDESCRWLVIRRRSFGAEAAEALAAAAALEAADPESLAASDLRDAVREQEAFAARLDALRASVAQRGAALAERGRARVAELLQRLDGVPREVAADACDAAERVLRRSFDAPSDEELAEIDRSGTLLEEACRVAEAYAVARARKIEVEAAAARVLPGIWRERGWRRARASRRALRTARAVFRGSRWEEAARAYESAGASLVELEQLRSARRARREQARRAAPAPWRAPQGAARRALLAIVLPLLAATVLLQRRPGLLREPGSPPPSRSANEARSTESEAAPSRSRASRERPIREAVRGEREVPDRAAAPISRPEPPEPVPPPVVALASASPSEARVELSEGAEQEFRAVLADALSESAASIEWRLDGETVARGVSVWTYRPGFDDARAEARTLELRVAAAGAAAATREWKIEVRDTNRAPAIVAALPDPAKPVSFRSGEAITLAAPAEDPDGDALGYEWTIDGRRAAQTGSELRFAPEGNAVVRVVVRDGAAETGVQWTLAKLPPRELMLETLPRELRIVPYGGEQAFEARVPAGEGDEVSLEWTLDGERVASGPRFVLRDIGPALVRKRPVRVTVRAAAREAGRRFTRTWEFQVRPPAPRIAGSPAPGDTVRLEPGRAQVFRAEPDRVIGEPGLRYTFSVDGAVVVRRGEGRYSFTAQEGRHRIEAFAEDVFGQRSAPVVWRVEVEAGLIARAERWIEELEQALNRKDVERIAELRGLSADASRALAGALAEQLGLEVRFAERRFEEIGPDRVIVRYRRSDRFQDAPSREQVTTAMEMETELGLSGGRLRERSTRRR